ncbi:MAG: hypothetical protein ACYSQZ_08665, partial [Planctomycetota bacterium]
MSLKKKVPPKTQADTFDYLANLYLLYYTVNGINFVSPHGHAKCVPRFLPGNVPQFWQVIPVAKEKTLSPNSSTSSSEISMP